MLILTANLSVAPASRPGFLAAAARLVAATREEAGCLGFAICEDPWSPGAFTVIGEWRDLPALDVHERSAHVASFKQEVAPLARSTRPTLVHDVAEVRELGAVMRDP